MQGLLYHTVTSQKIWEGLSQCDNENVNKKKYNIYDKRADEEVTISFLATAVTVVNL